MLLSPFYCVEHMYFYLDEAERGFYEACAGASFPEDMTLENVQAWLDENRDNMINVVAGILEDELEAARAPRH